MSIPTLDELINTVDSLHPDSDALEHLADAVAVSGRVGELADNLVGHYVDQARRAGASWTAIGEALGVSKQGAQQRFTPRGPLDASNLRGGEFGRYTQRAVSVLAAAREAAIARGDAAIRVGHVLLGICTDTRSLATRALSEQGTTLTRIRQLAYDTMPRSAGRPVDEPPFAPDVRALLELATREALRFGHNYVGTEHLLLGLLSDDDAEVTRILVDQGITYPSTRAIVQRLLEEHVRRLRR